jgi:hypothetical protein
MKKRPGWSRLSRKSLGNYFRISGTVVTLPVSQHPIADPGNLWYASH